MNESAFINQNIEHWEELEELLLSEQSDPIRLHDLFVKVSSDFAYARTYFPNRMVRIYLNELTQRVFNKIYRKKNRFDISSLVDFYQNTLPRELLRNKWALIISAVVFISAMSIGWLSSADDPGFLRSVLGDSYVEMTEENITIGDPMAVYKKANQVDMFLGITVNNIRVAINAYVLGLLFSIGSIVILIFNGVMLGSFQQFFHAEGLLMTSTLTIWIHGTLEISAIIIAGSAGIILGQGALLPGTLRRWTSFRIKARQSLNILLSTVPLFIVAGFLEGFVTRMTDWPDFVKVLIILTSLFVILYIYVIHPIRRKPYVGVDHIDLDDLNPDTGKEIPLLQVRDFWHNLSALIFFLRREIRPLFLKILLPVFIIFIITYRLAIGYENLGGAVNIYASETYLDAIKGGVFFYLIYLALFTYVQFVLGAFMRDKSDVSNVWNIDEIRRALVPYMIISICWVSGWYFLSSWYALIYYAVVTPHMLILSSHYTLAVSNRSILRIFTDQIKESFTSWMVYAPVSMSILILYFVLWSLYQSQLGQIITEYILWHEFFSSYWTNSQVLVNIFLLLLLLAAFIMGYIWILYTHYSLSCKIKSVDLQVRFATLKKRLDQNR